MANRFFLVYIVNMQKLHVHVHVHVHVYIYMYDSYIQYFLAIIYFQVIWTVEEYCIENSKTSAKIISLFKLKQVI